MTQSTKSMLLWGGLTLGIIGLVALLAMFGSGGGGTTATLEEAVSSEDHTKGGDNAQVTIVEYSDFQCPACATTYPVLKQLVNDYDGQVALVYRHYPLRSIHPQAQLSSQAAEAAAMQGKFWEMHDALFNTQSQWSSQTDPTEFFVSLANSLGLDTETFQSDLTSSAAANAVNEDYSRATGMNLPGTPSFFVNGTLIQNPGSYAAFKSVVDAALTK